MNTTVSCTPVSQEGTGWSWAAETWPQLTNAREDLHGGRTPVLWFLSLVSGQVLGMFHCKLSFYSPQTGHIRELRMHRAPRASCEGTQLLNPGSSTDGSHLIHKALRVLTREATWDRTPMFLPREPLQLALQSPGPGLAP